MGIYTIIWLAVGLATLASLVWLGFRELRVRLHALEARQLGSLQASGDPHHNTRIWLHLVGPVVLGGLLTCALNISGCNTTPTQSRVGKLEERMSAVEQTQKELGDKFVPRDEVKSRQEAVEKVQQQRDKRIDDLESTQAQILAYLMQHGGAHGQ